MIVTMPRNRIALFVKSTLIACIACLLAIGAQAADITGAFGYKFGESLAEKDILTRRPGMGPHDIIPKKKAGTVKTVHAYISPKTNSIVALDGINSFPTMAQCTEMVTMITFFLGKKYADSVDTKESIGDGVERVGVKFSDTQKGKVVMVSCTDSATEAVLSVRYGDVALTEQALKDWKKLEAGSTVPEKGLSL